jgi:hypothetical protein
MLADLTPYPSLQYVLCHTCRHKHPLDMRHASAQMTDYMVRHPGHHLELHPMLHVQRQQMERYRLHEPEWLDYVSNADVKVAYGASTGITITLVSLASNATVGRESLTIDNTGNLYLDAFVRLHIPLLTGSPANDQTIYVYRAGSEDGTNWTMNATGADAAITITNPTNLKLLGSIVTPTLGGLTWKNDPFPVAPTFGGFLPREWSIIVINFTGLAFNATEGNIIKAYSGVYSTVI